MVHRRTQVLILFHKNSFEKNIPYREVERKDVTDVLEMHLFITQVEYKYKYR